MVTKNLFFIAGPCVIEDEGIVMEIAQELKLISKKLGVDIIFKASYDKANRSSYNSFRGPGLEAGLKILSSVKQKTGMMVTSDIHETYQIESAAEVLDIIQIPALLCRQTDLIVKAAKTGKTVNVKKGQFMAPWDMHNVVEKIKSTGNNKIILTERGTTFGYNNLVVDFRSLPVMRDLGVPVVFDATHSVQLPGAGGGVSLGQRNYIPNLMRAAVATGVDGIFMEVHPDPDNALSDGSNSLLLAEVESQMAMAINLNKLVSE